MSTRDCSTWLRRHVDMAIAARYETAFLLLDLLVADPTHTSETRARDLRAALDRELAHLDPDQHHTRPAHRRAPGRG